MQSIRVNAKKAYTVFLGSDLQAQISAEFACHRGKQILLLSDKNVAHFHCDKLQQILENAGLKVYTYIVDAGEQSKSFACLEKLLSYMSEKKFTRDSILVALGGGVIGDLGGFAAGIYMRGIAYYQMPTSLLAMVDSSVGGKTAVNLDGVKNIVGLFNQPIAVYCDVNYLHTLPEREFSSALAEIIKYAVLFDEELFELLEQKLILESVHLERVIYDCIAHKARVVASDEFDNGERKLLNLGHTIAHAIEKCSAYQINHGEAVAMGIAMTARASLHLADLSAATVEKIIAALKAQGLETSCPYSADELLPYCLNDKKMSTDSIDEILINNITQPLIKKMSVKELKAYLNDDNYSVK